MNKVWADSSVDATTWRNCTKNLLLLLAPIAPHMTEELWEMNGHGYSIHQQNFPAWDDELAAEDSITLILQVNGKVRDKIEVSVAIDEAEAQALALASPRVQSHVEGKSVAKTVYVPGRLVNVVVS